MPALFVLGVVWRKSGETTREEEPKMPEFSEEDLEISELPEREAMAYANSYLPGIDFMASVGGFLGLGSVRGFIIVGG